jgi:nitrous oxidase accessory protein NosD
MLTLALCSLLALSSFGQEALDERPVIRVEADDTLVDRSCRLVFGDAPILDANGNGVVQIRGNDLVIECEGRLFGAAPGTSPDAYEGTGIRLTGLRNELRGARASGFRVGIELERATLARLVDADVSDNRRSRLLSTHEREDGADWLWPHANDAGEWSANWGAGLRVVESRGVRIERLLARDVQNGILLERVDESLVVGCDASFLSGWGLALWRSCDNRIVANRFDFCVRGYAHGLYNRGQDSAGVLLFEQSSRNTFEGNSLTHGGDGVFGFAGREALGEVPPRASGSERPFGYQRCGSNDNLFRANDMSFAAAHGLELTFSFGTRVEGNLFEENAICGVWFGYGRDSLFTENRFVGNGDAGYGAERGALNAEHGQRLSATANVFERNAIDVRLWTDADEGLAGLPWTRANGAGAKDNWIVGNRHVSVLAGDGAPRVELAACGATAIDLGDERVAADDASRKGLRRMPSDGGGLAERAAGIDAAALERVRRELLVELGVEPLPSGPRPRGRAAIVVGEWGPWDHVRPLVKVVERSGARARFAVYAAASDVPIEVHAGEAFDVQVMRDAAALAEFGDAPCALVEVRPKSAGAASAGRIELSVGGVVHTYEVALLAVAWNVRFAPAPVDPREDAARIEEVLAESPAIACDAVEFHFGGGGPIEWFEARGRTDDVERLRASALASDNFALAADTRVELPAGRWELVTSSDDGLRVRVDGELVIDDWTHHGPTEHRATFVVDEPREVAIDVRWFELGGHAECSVRLERAPQ